MTGGWTTRGSRTAYENPWLRVREDDVLRPDGAMGIYGVVEVRAPAVFVVALTDADEVVLVELFRYTTGAMSLELPAGGSDGQDPLVAAQRELREETGLEAATWQHLGPVHSLIGVADAPGHVFLARDLSTAADADRSARDQAEEGITAVRRVPWSEVLALVAAGEITSNEALGALLYAAVALGRLT